MKKIEPGLLGLNSRQQTDAAESFYFAFKPAGWAYFIVCEATGLFLIHSDWGSASFCWPAWAGKLKAELVTSDADYICTKLGYDKQREWAAQESVEKTVRAIRAEIDDNLIADSDNKRLVNEDLDEFCRFAEFEDLRHAFENIGRNLSEFLDGEFYEHIVYEEHPMKKMFKRALIPFFQNWLEAENARRKSEGADGSGNGDGGLLQV
jgi:hypothetical protein